MKFFSLYCILAVILIGTIACSCNSNDKTQPEPYFPVQKEVPIDLMQALLQGELVMDNAGCLRVKVTSDYSPLVIWPCGYSFKLEGEEILIINDKGQTVARVGDIVILGGGQVPASAVEERIGQVLPAEANGPYWIANPQ